MTELEFEQIGFVTIVEIRRPPHNFLDSALVSDLAIAFEQLDADPGCRAVVLAAAGTSFCAGGNFAGQAPDAESFSGSPSGAIDEDTHGIVDAGSLYETALRLFAINTPVVAAVHGSAIGGGLGLALTADFRVTCPTARWSANFSRLGFHPGFALSITLPELVGTPHARRLLYTGARINGDEAVEIGLADECVAADAVRTRSIEFASEIASGAPLAIQAIKSTLNRGRADLLRRAVEHELAEQVRLLATSDAREGIAAYAARRPPEFLAR